MPGPVKREMGRVTNVQKPQIMGKKNVEIINLYWAISSRLSSKGPFRRICLSWYLFFIQTKKMMTETISSQNNRATLTLLFVSANIHCSLETYLTAMKTGAHSTNPGMQIVDSKQANRNRWKSLPTRTFAGGLPCLMR